MAFISDLFNAIWTYLPSVGVSDIATHEIKREGAFDAIPSNIKVKHFQSHSYLSIQVLTVSPIKKVLTIRAILGQ